MTSDGTRVRKHSVVVAGHRTSVSMEDAFWDAFSALAQAGNRSINELVTEIDDQRQGSLSSAIKVHVLRHAQDRLKA